MKRILFFLSVIFIFGCTDLGTQDYTEYDTVRVTGYFESYEELTAQDPKFIVTSSELESVSDTITVRGLSLRAWNLPAPRVRLGLTLFDGQIPYNVKLAVKGDYELNYIYVPIKEYTLVKLEYPYAYTESYRLRFDDMILDRRQEPQITVGETFKATVVDSSITSLDR